MGLQPALREVHRSGTYELLGRFNGRMAPCMGQERVEREGKKVAKDTRWIPFKSIQEREDKSCVERKRKSNHLNPFNPPLPFLLFRGYGHPGGPFLPALALPLTISMRYTYVSQQMMIMEISLPRLPPPFSQRISLVPVKMVLVWVLYYAL